MGFFMMDRRLRWGVILLGAVCVLVVTLVLSSLWFVNSRILPRGINRIEAAAESRYPLQLTIESGSLRLFRGLQFRGIGVTVRGESVRSAAETVDVDLSLRTLLRIARVARGTATPPIEVGALDGPGGLWRLVEVVAAAGLLPETITARDVNVALAGGPLTEPYPLRFESIVVSHDADARALTVATAGASSPVMAVEVTSYYQSRNLDAELTVDELPIPVIPRPRFSPSGGTFVGSLRGRYSEDGSLNLAGVLGVRDLSIDAPVVTPDTIRPIDVSYAFEAKYDPNAPPADVPAAVPESIRRHFPRGSLTVRDGTLTFNGIELALSAVFSGLDTGGPHPISQAPEGIPRRILLEVSLPRTPVARLNAAIPDALRGPLDTLELQGNFSWNLALNFPRYDPGGLQWEADVILDDFAVLRVADSANPFGLNGAFIHTIRDPAIGYVRRVLIPPADSGPLPAAAPATGVSDPTFTYVRLEDMSPWIPEAVLTAEDGAFYYHDGVNFRTLAQAVVRNLSEKDVIVGASTISMQVVKMLFLNDDRIFSRKLQEVFLVYLMEHQVPVAKDRILEIYLNIAEFGPGVFGIHDAARYYFGKDPAELSLGEATFLASILPSPKRYHWYYTQGEISDGWFIRMKSYYDVMRLRGTISQEEYDAALEEKPVFAKEAIPAAS
jgi:hypothetical protein